MTNDADDYQEHDEFFEGAHHVTVPVKNNRRLATPRGNRCLGSFECLRHSDVDEESVAFLSGEQTLFGAFPGEFYDSYQESRPLDVGYKERYPLYNLYHLLNHLNLFGVGYLGQVKAILEPFA